MTLPGECVNDTETECFDCEEPMKIGVYQSGAGFYIGFFCKNCGPYSRESLYYGSRANAEKALKDKTYSR